MSKRKYIRVESGTVSVTNSDNSFQDVTGIGTYSIPDTQLDLNLEIDGINVDIFTYSLPSAINYIDTLPITIVDSIGNTVSWTYNNGVIIINELPCGSTQSECFLVDEFGIEIIDEFGDFIIVPCGPSGSFVVDNYGFNVEDNNGGFIVIP